MVTLFPQGQLEATAAKRARTRVDVDSARAFLGCEATRCAAKGGRRAPG